MTKLMTRLGDAPLSAWIGIVIVTLIALTAIFAPLLAPFPEVEVVGPQYSPWAAPHYLGTDALGRDVLSRMIYGARNTVGIALLTTALAFLLGATFGLLAATLGGWFDMIASRVVDVLMAIPALIFALLVLTITGTSVFALILVIAVLDSTRVYRLSRAVAQGILTMDYVEVARMRGEGLFWIIRREVLPNAAAPLIAEFGLRFCFVFLFISALSFLGLGLQPPIADWGAMVRESAKLISFADFSTWQTATFGLAPLLPAGAIALLTVSVNLIVDWVLHLASGLED
ncbi:MULTISPECIES: ABC transporter permease [Mameliella]|uniref:Binding-protein-dependent transport systems inner membrane component n=1 Tax=Mameliella alba TaxID=561184 RepID=A0A0B3S4K5_9RHOB|nr:MULTISPECIES: ABC transporter permease [Mameliella]ODM45218.1 ABC transporter permease [Ruegeria sp. PBVC088]KHQ51626.1 Binding-protein-dependent transport systems inner membrane component [Mameliella alba]MDD9730754.1 ABC transporter permease [Mameliella sp. AT18]OWV40918.1 ABC transporter permease [Mameliella alba]OWV46319.1 ABC transporter permease [Mameliella alba]